MPSTKLVTINWAALMLSGVSSAAICGRAGSIESMEKAMVAKSIAIRAMNSVWPSRGLIGLGLVSVAKVISRLSFP